MKLHSDFIELLRALFEADARFMIIGGYAVGFHGRPRATKDLDIWIDANDVNARKVFAALGSFGAPLAAIGLHPEDLARPGVGFHMGRPPLRVDFLTKLPGVEFEACWSRAAETVVEGVHCRVIAVDDLVANKRAVGRPQDLADVDALERVKAIEAKEKGASSRKKKRLL